MRAGAAPVTSSRTVARVARLNPRAARAERRSTAVPPPAVVRREVARARTSARRPRPSRRASLADSDSFQVSRQAAGAGVRHAQAAGGDGAQALAGDPEAHTRRGDGDDAPSAPRRRRIGVARQVDRAHLDRVLAVGESAPRPRRRARLPRSTVQPALQASPRFGDERERRRPLRRRRTVLGRPGDQRLRRRRVDRPRLRGRARVHVAGGVDGADLEGMAAVAERGVGGERRARREGGAVQPALEARARLRRADRERGVRGRS